MRHGESSKGAETCIHDGFDFSHFLSVNLISQRDKEDNDTGDSDNGQISVGISWQAVESVDKAREARSSNQDTDTSIIQTKQDLVSSLTEAIEEMENSRAHEAENCTQ